MGLNEVLETLPQTNKNVVVVLSGGLDSTIMMRVAVERYGAEQIRAISFDYGQRQNIELERAAESCEYLGVKHTILPLDSLNAIAMGHSANVDRSIKMPTIEDVLGDPSPDTEVPFRNMILLALASSYAQCNDADVVLTGLQSNDTYNYWDTTDTFVSKMNSVLSENRITKIRIVAPFIKLNKTAEIAILGEIGDLPLLAHTITCYNPDDNGFSCGICPSCAERLKAFENLGLEDPVYYNTCGDVCVL